MKKQELLEKRKQTSLNIDSDLWKRIKIKAIEREVDAQDLVAEALRKWLDEDQ